MSPDRTCVSPEHPPRAGVGVGVTGEGREGVVAPAWGWAVACVTALGPALILTHENCHAISLPRATEGVLLARGRGFTPGLWVTRMPLWTPLWLGCSRELNRSRASDLLRNVSLGDFVMCGRHRARLHTPGWCHPPHAWAAWHSPLLPGYKPAQPRYWILQAKARPSWGSGKKPPWPGSSA